MPEQKVCGWRYVFVPCRSEEGRRKRRFTQADLERIARKVCEEEGRDAVIVAARRAIQDCDPGIGSEIECAALDAAIGYVRIVRERYETSGRVRRWAYDAAAYLLGWLPGGVKIGKDVEVDFADAGEFFQALVSGELEQQLRDQRAMLRCSPFVTGGGV